MKYKDQKKRFNHWTIYKLIILASIKCCFATNFICPRKCQCLEGGIVVCQNKYLLDVPRNIPNNTQHLYIGANFIRRIRRDAFHNLKDLKTLEISSNVITTIESGAFSYTKDLTTLTMRDNLVSRISKDTFKGLKKLQNLDLSNLAPEGVALCIEDLAFVDLANLLSFKLDRNNIIGLTNLTLYGLNKLETLDLSYNNIQLISAGAFQAIAMASIIFDDTIKCCCSTVEAMKSIMGNTNGRCLKSCYDYPPHCQKIIESTCLINIHPLYFLQQMERAKKRTTLGIFRKQSPINPKNPEIPIFKDPTFKIPVARIPKRFENPISSDKPESLESQMPRHSKHTGTPHYVLDRNPKLNTKDDFLSRLAPPSSNRRGFNRNLSLEIQKQLHYISNLHQNVSGLDKRGQWSIAIVTCIVLSVSFIMVLVAVYCKKRRFSYEMNLIEKCSGSTRRPAEYVNCPNKRQINLMNRYSPTESMS